MTDPRLLWWIDRSAGLVSLVMLSVVTVLGILAAGRPRAARGPRSFVQALHRQLSLVATVLLGVHIGAAVADAFVPLRLVDVVVPFRAGYRPVWVGLGTLALDLLVALVVTSLLRARLGRVGWRTVHWAAYALWPLAVVHALGSGNDLHAQPVHLVGVVCVAMVLGGTGWRLIAGTGPAWVRTAGLVVLLAVTAVATGWATQGPLVSGWAHRALAPVPWSLR